MENVCNVQVVKSKMENEFLKLCNETEDLNDLFMMLLLLLLTLTRTSETSRLCTFLVQHPHLAVQTLPCSSVQGTILMDETLKQSPLC